MHRGTLVLYYRAERASHRVIKVGIPAAPIGMNDKILHHCRRAEEPGYATGQFGKNHLGDLNHMLPTNHGFDEFFGNLYHLNAEEEPEMYDYYSGEGFPEPRKEHQAARRRFIPGQPTRMTRPRCRVGGKSVSRRLKIPVPLNTKRMETCDDEFVAAASDFIKRQNKDGKPFFVWLNTTHMHLSDAYEEEPSPGGTLAIALSRHHDRP